MAKRKQPLKARHRRKRGAHPAARHSSNGTNRLVADRAMHERTSPFEWQPNFQTAPRLPMAMAVTLMGTILAATAAIASIVAMAGHLPARSGSPASLQRALRVLVAPACWLPPRRFPCLLRLPPKGLPAGCPPHRLPARFRGAGVQHRCKRRRPRLHKMELAVLMAGASAQLSTIAGGWRGLGCHGRRSA